MIRFFSLSILVLILADSAHAVSIENCKADEIRWISTYADSDPYEAWNKTTPLTIQKDILNSLMAGRPLDSKQLPKLTLTYGSDTMTVAQYAEKFPLNVTAPTSRDLAILENLKAFLKRPRPINTLRFAYIGFAHSVHLYDSSPELALTYANKPFQLSTTTYSPGFHVTTKSLNTNEMPYSADTVSQLALAYYFTPYYDGLEIQKVFADLRLPARTFKHSAADSRAIVLAEVHEPNSSTWMDQLSTAECLKLSGINHVEVALEGYRSTASIYFDEIIKRRTMVEQLEFRAAKANMTFDAFLARLPEDVRQTLLSGQLIDNTSQLAFINKLKTYVAAGISVNFVGLESPTYNELGE